MDGPRSCLTELVCCLLNRNFYSQSRAPKHALTVRFDGLSYRVSFATLSLHNSYHGSGFVHIYHDPPSLAGKTTSKAACGFHHFIRPPTEFHLPLPVHHGSKKDGSAVHAFTTNQTVSARGKDLQWHLCYDGSLPGHREIAWCFSGTDVTNCSGTCSPLRAFGLAYASVVAPQLLTILPALYRRGSNGWRLIGSVSLSMPLLVSYG